MLTHHFTLTLSPARKIQRLMFGFWLSTLCTLFLFSSLAVHAKTIEITSGKHHIDSAPIPFVIPTVKGFAWHCPDDYSHAVNWKNNSSSSHVKAIENVAFEKDSDKIDITFNNFDSHDHDFGIIYRCSDTWPPTTSDCGGEGETVCWGALKLEDPGWRGADFMFQYNGTGACDHGLIINNITSTAKCKDSTRHDLDGDGKGGTWATWALDNQRYSLQAREPINWMTQLGTHESYNNNHDLLYLFPNQIYTISDQLDAGARQIDLRPRWGVGSNNYLRLSHGTNDCGGCSGQDRPYTYAIEEIGDWLDKNPGQFILLRLQQYDGNNHSYVDDPLEKYFGDKVLGPQEWCKFLTGDASKCTDGKYTPPRWPTLAELRTPGNWSCNCSKQVMVFENNSDDSKYTFGLNITPGLGDRFARRFDGAKCLQNGNAFVYGDNGVTREQYNQNFPDIFETRVYGEATAAHSDWPGYIYAHESDIPSSDDDTTGIAAVRPYASQATSVDALLGCNVPLIDLDFFMSDKFYNGNGHPLDNQSDRREAFVWTWSKNDKGEPHTAAIMKNFDGRFHSEDRASLHHAACALETQTGSGLFRTGDPSAWQDPAGLTWRVTANQYSWQDASQGCQDEYGAESYVFAVPVNKQQENHLIAANTNGYDLWLAYTNETSSNQWTVTGAPTLAVGTFSVDEGSSTQLTARGASLSGAALNYDWDLDNNGSFETQGQAQGFSAGLLDGPVQRAVKVRVTDSDGLQRVKQTTITINNVAPTVAAGETRIINEGGTATLTPVAFHDVGGFDTHTATIEWGDGTQVVSGAVTESPSGSSGASSGINGTVAGSHVYGDNGSYTVKTCVTDDDGGTGCNNLTVMVNNVSPAVTLDTSSAIAFGDGAAFLGRLGVEQSHSASATDPGSDDLTFYWSYAPSTGTSAHIYFNNGGSPDPAQSGPGIFPFSRSDTNRVTFTSAGIYTARVVLSDDEGGADFKNLPQVITGNANSNQDTGFWRQQFTPRGAHQLSDLTLQNYLNIVSFSSRLFSERVGAATLAQAQAVMQPGGANVGDSDPSNMKGKATQEAFAAWLNFANGGVGWNQLMPTGQTYHDAMAQVETVLLNPNSTHQDYVRAKNIAESVNHVKKTSILAGLREDEDLLGLMPGETTAWLNLSSWTVRVAPTLFQPYPSAKGELRRGHRPPEI